MEARVPLNGEPAKRKRGRPRKSQSLEEDQAPKKRIAIELPQAERLSDKSDKPEQEKPEQDKPEMDKPELDEVSAGSVTDPILEFIKLEIESDEEGGDGSSRLMNCTVIERSDDQDELDLKFEIDDYDQFMFG